MVSSHNKESQRGSYDDAAAGSMSVVNVCVCVSRGARLIRCRVDRPPSSVQRS